MKQKSCNSYILKFLAYKLIILMCISSFDLCGQTYSFVWSDEFDYTGLPDTTKWNYDVGGHGWGNQELQYYTYRRTENARVEDGKLIIEARKESYSGKDYTSARLVTKNQGDWLYGKIEVSAKLPKGRGTWPAIWMLPTDWEYGDWPSSGEIDIMEHVGYDEGVVHATVHTEAFNHTLGTQKGNSVNLPDATSVFHVYSVEWTPSEMYFFADGNKYFTFIKYEDNYKKRPFDKRFHLLLNIAVGGSWGGAQGVDVNAFPATMEVDYVRVYQLTTGTGTLNYEWRKTKSNNSLSDIEIFPNPFNDQVKIYSSTDFNQIEIFNYSGYRSYCFQDNLIYNPDLTLNLSGLMPGIYFISLKYQNNLVGVKKAIKYD